MGIDAEMVVRNVPRSQVTDEWLKEMSWRLAQSIGAEHFWIGQARTALRRTCDNDYDAEEGIVPGTKYTQDGPDVDANPGECLLEVSLCGRYYGVEYERGDILTYCAIAEWLEQNIPGCRVWYGGGSSGVLLEPFTKKMRDALKAHLYGANGRDYFGSFANAIGDSPAKPPACAICPGNRYHGHQYGFGGSGTYAAFRCPGCGKSVETRDGCKTWHTPTNA